MTTTRQDLLAATEVAKNKIIEKLVTKYDVQIACDAIKDEILESIQAVRSEDQASARQANAMRDQIWQRLLKLEEEIKKLRAEVRLVNRDPVDEVARKVY
jgi:hypothetical protein